MTETDVQREWRKLEEAYGGMSDEELCSLAEQAYKLTDLARQALQAEITTRGLQAQLAEKPPRPSESEEDEQEGDLDPAELNLVSTARVWEAGEARDTMKVLYDAGIPAYLGPENVEDAAKFGGSFEAGVDIRVRDIDQERALIALAQALPQTGEDAAEGEPFTPRCPKCRSDEVVFAELVPAAGAAESAEANKFRWRCEACGHEWEDDGVQEEQDSL